MKEQTARSAEPFAGSPVHLSTDISYAPEENPFSVVFADITHRCNMACTNCYIPNRVIPDMNAAWLYGILARLPRRTRIRLVGAEPTMRSDLPDIIRRVRALGHHPVILSNGLKLGNRRYVAALKAAGLRTIYLSLNGGLKDEYYEIIDGMRCAQRKLRALSNLLEENYYVTVGMIVVPALNEHHIGAFFEYLSAAGVRDFHLRSVGSLGRHMPNATIALPQLISIAARELGVSEEAIETHGDETPTSRAFVHQGMHIQLTQWPDLGSQTRGRLTPEGRIEPCFEHLMLNAARGGY